MDARMIRLIAPLISAAMAGAALAQPAPRVMLDVPVPAAERFRINHEGPGARLAVGRDGTHHILVHQFQPAAQSLEPATAARIDLVAVASDGELKRRQTLPATEKITFNGFAIASLGIVTASSGDHAVFWSANDPDIPARGDRSRFATLLHLAADGGVKKTSAIGPPNVARGRTDARAYYELYVYAPTPDNAVLLGGGFGSGPYAWWMGKFNLDGVRLWQAGPGNGFPERVAAAARRLDGSWLSLVTEMPRSGGLDWVIRRNAADGTALSRTRLPMPVGYEAAVLRNGSVLIANAGDGRAAAQELVFVDDRGHIRRRSPWPFAQTLRLIADGDGLAAIVEDDAASDGQRTVVRADATGAIRWRSAAADVTEIMRTPDGHIAALVRTGKDGEGLRLVRYADP